VFGVFKRELSLVMLIQAMGTSRLLEVLTKTQILTFTVFVIFYIPCVATMGVLAKEFGFKRMVYIAGLTIAIATFLALLVRIGGMIL
jgi:ferrous iron transport protein B